MDIPDLTFSGNYSYHFTVTLSFHNLHYSSFFVADRWAVTTVGNYWDESSTYIPQYLSYVSYHYTLIFLYFTLKYLDKLYFIVRWRPSSRYLTSFLFRCWNLIWKAHLTDHWHIDMKQTSKRNSRISSNSSKIKPLL